MAFAEKKLSRGDVYVVDDDDIARESLEVIFTVAGYRVTGFSDGQSFLSAAAICAPRCIILDVHMPLLSGIDILKAIQAPKYPVPIFILSGDADIALAVEAIKGGAFDYIVKPFEAQNIVERIAKAIEGQRFVPSRRPVPEHVRPAIEFPGRNLLTPRESEVLAEIAGGYSNKEAGRRLGISPRTIEVHRARIMAKLGARNAADLVRIVLAGASGRGSAARPSAPEMVA